MTKICDDSTKPDIEPKFGNHAFLWLILVKFDRHKILQKKANMRGH